APDRLRAQQRPNVASASGIRRQLVDRLHPWLVFLCHALSSLVLGRADLMLTCEGDPVKRSASRIECERDRVVELERATGSVLLLEFGVAECCANRRQTHPLDGALGRGERCAELLSKGVG